MKKHIVSPSGSVEVDMNAEEIRAFSQLQRQWAEAPKEELVTVESRLAAIEARLTALEKGKV